MTSIQIEFSSICDNDDLLVIRRWSSSLNITPEGAQEVNTNSHFRHFYYSYELMILILKVRNEFQLQNCAHSALKVREEIQLQKRSALIMSDEFHIYRSAHGALIM